MEKPKLLLNPDIQHIDRVVTDFLELAEENNYIEDDFEHYVFEATMEALYGKNFWKWFNKQSWIK